MGKGNLLVIDPTGESARVVAEALRHGATVVVVPTLDAAMEWQATMPMEKLAGATWQESMRVDVRSHTVRINDNVIPLTELEFRVLSVLISDSSKAWSFRELRTAAWGGSHPCRSDPKAVRSVVQRLRTKLALFAEEYAIESVRGFGFRLTTVGDQEKTQERDSDLSRD